MEAGCAIIRGVDLIVDCRLWRSFNEPNPVGFTPGTGIGLESVLIEQTLRRYLTTFIKKGDGMFGKVSQ